MGYEFPLTFIVSINNLNETSLVAMESGIYALTSVVELTTIDSNAPIDEDLTPYPLIVEKNKAFDNKLTSILGFDVDYIGNIILSQINYK